MIENHKLQVFLKIIETGNLTTAAAQLGFTQPGISHILGSLEEDLGLILFERGRLGASLTKEGQALEPYIRKAFQAEADLENAAMELKGLSKGSIKLGSYTSFSLEYLPALLRTYSAKYPGVEIEVKNLLFEEIEAGLLDGSLDCAFMTRRSGAGYRQTDLMSEDMMAVMPKSHPLAGRSSIAPEDLNGENLIVPAEQLAYDIGSMLKAKNVVPGSFTKSNDDLAALKHVIYGDGITIFSRSLAANLDPLAAAVPIEGFKRRIVLAVPDRQYQSPCVREFVNCCRACLSEEAATSRPTPDRRLYD